jgi:TRAP-type C4-dicarboxylate transport system substrate-binding protein
MKAKGMEVCYPDKADFRKAAATVKADWVKKMGAGMEGWINDIENKY